MKLPIILAACLVVSSASASPISDYGIRWGSLVSVMGGTGNIPYVNQYWYDPIYGSVPTAREAVSRYNTDTWAAFSASVSTVEYDRLFELTFTATAEAYASVRADAVAGTSATAYAYDFGPYSGFTLTEASQYLGTLVLYGVNYGDILQPGTYDVNVDAFNVRADAFSDIAGFADYSRVTRTGTARFVAVPEPGTLLLLGAGLVPMMLRRRRSLERPRTAP